MLFSHVGYESKISNQLCLAAALETGKIELYLDHVIIFTRNE